MPHMPVDPAPTRSPVQFGAVGDGVTDDTEALQDWIDAAGVDQQPLELPPGTYKVTSSLTMSDDDTELRGYGDLSIIAASAAVSGHTLILSGDRIRVTRVKVTKATATFGAAIYVDAAHDCKITDVAIDSQDMGIRIGDTAAATTSLRCLVEHCRITALDACVRTRTGVDDVAMAHHKILFNDLTQTGPHQAVESWTGGTLIEGNSCIAPGFDGGTAGITVGLKAQQRIISNRVEGYAYGIEAGNTGYGIQINNNTVVACGVGLSVSTIGGVIEEAVILNGNVVIMTDDRIDGDQTCVKLTGARTVVLSGGALMYESDGDYTDSASRHAYGVDASNDVETIHLDHVQFVNLEQGLRAGSLLGGVHGIATLSGCLFENCYLAIYDTGGTPSITVNGGRFNNCYQNAHNYRASYQGVAFTRAADHPVVNKGFAQFDDGESTLCTINNCSFLNTLDTSFIGDSSRAITGNSYKRPAVEIRDHYWVVGNYTLWSEVAAAIALADLDEPEDVPIHTWFSGLSFTNGVATGTIAANAVTNTELANMATATFKGRTTSGTGDPEDLTVTQATAMLNAATATVAGLVPTPPNNTTTFLRGDATFAAPVRTLWLWYGAAAVTAGSTDVFLNPAGISTTPATTTSRPYSCPKTGTIVSVLYHTNTAHTTNTVTVEARINGTPTAVGPVSVTAGVTDLDVAVSPGVAVVRGDTISCQIDHNGATGLVNCLVGFEIQYT